MLQMIFWTAAGLVTLVTLFKVAVLPVIRTAREFTAWWRKFQRDWDGTPEEPGRAAVPGVMERLNQMDGQLQRNGGESLKDKVCDTHRLAVSLNDRVLVIEGRQKEIHEEQRRIIVDLERMSGGR